MKKTSKSLVEEAMVQVTTYTPEQARALQKRRAKKSGGSSLEGIPGVGPRRRRELLRYFGGIQGIERASLEELVRVPGISRKIAEDVYATFHNQ